MITLVRPFSRLLEKVNLEYFWLFLLTLSFLGQLSEEGAEHFNKLLKIDEIHHAPQCDRTKRLETIFNRGLERSDPLVREYEKKDSR